MKISERGVELIKQFEGRELEAYQDIAGVWTIGYGHTGPDVKPGMRISESEAEALLKKDLKPREDAVAKLASVPLNQNEFDALVSFIYNVGAGAFQNSTARKRLNRGDRLGAADALTWWNKATVGGVLREVLGLTRRRAAEKALFLTPVNPPIVREPKNLQENSRAPAVEAPPRRGNVAESRTVQGAAVAGGAGVAASTIGHNNAEELDHMETNIESGTSMTATSVDRRENEMTADVGEDGEVSVGDGADVNAGELITTPDRPSKHEVHAVEAQIQFALLVLIILSVLFVIFARVDDWWRYKR